MAKGRPKKDKNDIVVEKNNKSEKKVDSVLEDLIKNVLKESVILSNSKEKYTVKQWFDTGSAVFNLLVSGDMYKGVPDNRAFQLVGDPSSSKSYMTKKIMKSAISQGWRIIYIDTEGDVEISDYEKAGLDTSKILMVEDADDITKVTNKMLNVVEYSKIDPKIMIVVDSIGNLASEKEITDALDGNDKADMSRAKKLKAFFRMILKKAFNKRIPLVLINHQYDSQGMFVQKVVGGGMGSRFASTFIIELSKAQFKKGDEVIGIIVTAKNKKNRFTKEYKEVKFYIDYNGGISFYSGIAELLVQYKLAQKIGGAKKAESKEEKKEAKKVAGFVIDGVEYYLKNMDNETWEECIKKHNINERLGDLFKYKNKTENVNIEEDDIDDELNDDLEDDKTTEETTNDED